MIPLLSIIDQLLDQWLVGYDSYPYLSLSLNVFDGYRTPFPSVYRAGPQDDSSQSKIYAAYGLPLGLAAAVPLQSLFTSCCSYWMSVVVGPVPVCHCWLFLGFCCCWSFAMLVVVPVPVCHRWLLLLVVCLFQGSGTTCCASCFREDSYRHNCWASAFDQSLTWTWKSLICFGRVQ